MYMNRAFVFAAIAQVVTSSMLAQSHADTSWRAADAAVANRVAGCYQLVDDGWQADSDLARFTTVPQGPVRFELTKSPDRNFARLSAFEHRTYFTVHVDSIPVWGRELFTTWTRVPGNERTIDVSRPLPMGGLALLLAPRDRDMVGKITSFTDAIPPDGISEISRPVTAARISCEKMADHHSGSSDHRRQN